MNHHHNPNPNRPSEIQPATPSPTPPPPGRPNHLMNILAGIRQTPPPLRRQRKLFCICCCVTITLAVLFIAAAVFFLMVRPTSPSYTVTSISFSGADNQTKFPSTINVTVRANNPSKKVGILYYERYSKTSAYLSTLRLAQGTIPALYQPPRSVTEFNLSLNWVFQPENIIVYEGLSETLAAGKIPLALKIRAPVRFKVGSTKTLYKRTVKIYCGITVSDLTKNATIIWKSCHYRN